MLKDTLPWLLLRLNHDIRQWFLRSLRVVLEDVPMKNKGKYVKEYIWKVAPELLYNSHRTAPN